MVTQSQTACRWHLGVLGPVGDFLSPPPLHGALVQCENPPTASATVSTIYISSAVPYTSLLMAWTFPVEVLLFINLLFAHSHFTESLSHGAGTGIPGSWRRERSVLQLLETPAALGNLRKRGRVCTERRCARASASLATDTTAVRLPEVSGSRRKAMNLQAHQRALDAAFQALRGVEQVC